MKWYFKNFIVNEDMGYNYTQVGQENSFGWDNIKKGIPMQMEFLNKLVQEGKVRVEKLCDTGKCFSRQYDMTPATVYSALDDWADLDNQSVWYNSKRYRLNLFSDGKEVWIRDIHKFDENYRDLYLDKPCEVNDAVQDALPVVDGFRFSDETTKAGIFFGDGKIKKTWREGDKFLALFVADGKEITLIMDENQIVMESDMDFTAQFVYKKDCEQVCSIKDNKINYQHNGVEYCLCLKQGSVLDNCFESHDGLIHLSFD